MRGRQLLVPVCLVFFASTLKGLDGGTESQFIGYEHDVNSSSRLFDNVTVTNRTILTDVTWPFPSDGQVQAFHVTTHPDIPSQDDVIIQIWRPLGNLTFSLVTSASLSNKMRHIVPDGDKAIRRGDVMGVYFSGSNPVPYEEVTAADGCGGSWVMSAEGGRQQPGDVMSFDRDVTCKRYLMTAEYSIEQTALRMDILGYDIISRPLVDNDTNTVVIPDPKEGFPVAGEVYGWKAYLEEPNQEVVFQIWRPINSTYYTLINEGPPMQMPITGALHIRLRPQERVNILTGDVIGFRHTLKSPFHYELGSSCGDGETIVKQSEDGNGAWFSPVGGANKCRHYSLQAEYHRADVLLPLPSPTSDTTTTTHRTSPMTPPMTSQKPQVTDSTTAEPTTKPISTPTTTTTFSPTNPVTNATYTSHPEPVTMETTSSTSPVLSPTTSITTATPSSSFGWELQEGEATEMDGVDYGTVIPDVGKAFPHAGKIIGWEFNVSHSKHKVGLQVWRPMPIHKKLFPHGRDFAFVGETKPIWPWPGLNRLHMDQVGEAPIHFKAGDVIGLRLDAPNPIPYAVSSDCEGRYYMDAHDQFDRCDQMIFQATDTCRTYPIRAIVIWDDEPATKAKDCVDQSEDLPGGKTTHIDGCVVLNIKAASGSYRLTNPDYPNITKHRDLCWVIHVNPSLDPDLYIQVKLNDLDIHVPESCGASASDFLEIRDGKSSKSALLRHYCVGWAAGNDVTRTELTTACQPYMYLRMRTSASSFYFRGFKLHYFTIKKDMLEKTCVRPLPLTAPNTNHNLPAAVITIAVVAVVIAAVFLLAYVKKRGFKFPQWLSCLLFKHQRFDNPIGHGIPNQSDSPQHMIRPSTETIHQRGGGSQGEYQLQQAGFDSAYVQFSPGGYPNNEQPQLRLGNIDNNRHATRGRPGNHNAAASSVMEGVSELPEEAIIKKQTEKQKNSHNRTLGQQNGGSAGMQGERSHDDLDLFPPPSDIFGNNNVTILPSQHVIVDHQREPSHSVI